MWPSTVSVADVVGALVQCRIAFDALTEDLVDPAEQIGAEVHPGGLHVVVHLIGARGPDDGRGHVLASAAPMPRTAEPGTTRPRRPGAATAGPAPGAPGRSRDPRCSACSSGRPRGIRRVLPGRACTCR